jgi:chemotaxis signal transduction protein
VSVPEDDLRQRLAELRGRFDAAFGEAPASRDRDCLDLLAVQAGGRRLAVPLADLAGLEPRGRVVAIPQRDRALRGLASARGRLVAAWDLDLLMGGEGCMPGWRWMLLCGPDPSVALACDQIEGMLRQPRSALVGAGGTSGLPPRASAVLVLPGQSRFVVDVRGVLDEVRRRVEATRGEG